MKSNPSSADGLSGLALAIARLDSPMTSRDRERTWLSFSLVLFLLSNPSCTASAEGPVSGG